MAPEEELTEGEGPRFEVAPPPASRPTAGTCVDCNDEFPVHARGAIPIRCRLCARLRLRAGQSATGGQPRKMPTKEQMDHTLALRATELRLANAAATALLEKGIELQSWTEVRQALRELRDIVDIRKHTAGWD